MKRFLILPSLLAMALALTNCAKTEVSASYDPSDNLEIVNVSFATAKNLTRAADTATTSLETSAKTTDLIIHVVSEAAAQTQTGFNLYFNYDGAAWNQTSSDHATNLTGELRWSDIEMPARFYSVFVGSTANTDGISDTGVSQTLSSTDNVMAVVPFTQADAGTGESQTHQDVVYAAQQVTSTPVGGKVTMTFAHILSKIDIFVETIVSGETTGNTAHIQSAKLMTVAPTASIQPEYSKETSLLTSLWTTPETTSTVDYGYFVNDNTDDATDWNGSKVAIQSDANGAMMIIPQTLTGLAITDGKMALPDPGNDGLSYVEVIYYSTDVNGGSFAGYKEASESWTYEPKYAGDVVCVGAVEYDDAQSAWVDAAGAALTYYNAADDLWYSDAEFNTNITATTEGYFAYPAEGDALYVKVGFPFNSVDGQTFAQGMYYNLILGMSTNSSGGYLLEKNFYDKDGNQLPVLVNEQVLEPGDPMTPDADGTIGIVVLVTAWDDATTAYVEDAQD